MQTYLREPSGHRRPVATLSRDRGSRENFHRRSLKDCSAHVSFDTGCGAGWVPQPQRCPAHNLPPSPVYSLESRGSSPAQSSSSGGASREPVVWSECEAGQSRAVRLVRWPSLPEQEAGWAEGWAEVWEEEREVWQPRPVRPVRLTRAATAHRYCDTYEEVRHPQLQTRQPGPARPARPPGCCHRSVTIAQPSGTSQQEEEQPEGESGYHSASSGYVFDV